MCMHSLTKNNVFIHKRKMKTTGKDKAQPWTPWGIFLFFLPLFLLVSALSGLNPGENEMEHLGGFGF